MHFNWYEDYENYYKFMDNVPKDEIIVFTIRYISELPPIIVRCAIGWYIFRNADLVLPFDSKILKVGEYIYLKKLPRPVHIAYISKVDPLSKNGFARKYFPAATRWITSIEHYENIQFELDLNAPVVFCFSELPPNVEIDYFIRDS